MILSLLVVGLAFYGFVWYDTGENPINKLEERNPTKHLDAAEQAADAYGSSLDKTLDQFDGRY